MAEASDIDWTTSFDHFNPEYGADPYTIWRDLQASGVIARGEDWRGVWVPTRHADVCAVANDPETFSNRGAVLAKFASMADFGLTIPPISSDPPQHTEIRRLLLPYFAPRRVEALRHDVEQLADELIDGFIDDGHCDGAIDYARYIPVRVIARMLGIPLADEPTFFRWVHEIVETAPLDLPAATVALMDFFGYFRVQLEQRRAAPGGDDLISYLATSELEGRPLEDHEILSTCLLLLIAGIDTTWSSIGASLWHLAHHPDDRASLRADPDLWLTGVEELLRAYAPVTMAREVTVDTEALGCPMHAGDPLLLPFPAANRDPEVFPDADEVHLDRQANRHVAFGVGIHRCLGS
ncbi:MAG: cytochrome P450, partial [Acidimicrobiales bacterium]|nr:cytochrome P450 [Acidimicrobiales bacterium]